jgi:hypothetical protein
MFDRFLPRRLRRLPRDATGPATRRRVRREPAPQPRMRYP